MKIVYVTGNSFKVQTATKLLAPFGIEVIQKKIYCPEIQDNDISNVSKFSAKYASDKLKSAVLKNDSGLCIDALKGFPGPYTAYVEDTITEDGILKLMQNETNRKACFVEVLSYCEYGKEPVSFTSLTYGTIATQKKGQWGWSYDRIFIPDGQDKTLAQIDDNERYKFWSDDAYIQLKDYLLSK